MRQLAWPDTCAAPLRAALIAIFVLGGCTSAPAASADGGGDAPIDPGATPSPDGMGYCCPLGTPSCNTTPLGGFSSTGTDCAMRRVIDAHPTMFQRVTDEHGCDVWNTMNPGESCLMPRDAGADASVEPDAGFEQDASVADASEPDAGAADAP